MLRIRTEKKEYCVEYWDGATEGKPRPLVESDILARFYGCPLTPTELSRVLDKHRNSEWESPDKKQAKQRFEKFDNLGFSHERVCRVLTRWEGIVDDNGNEIECDDKNKVIMFEYNAGLMRWVMDEFDKIGEQIEADREAERKNSVSGQSGEQG